MPDARRLPVSIACGLSTSASLAVALLCLGAPLHAQSTPPEVQRLLREPLSRVSVVRLLPHVQAPEAARRVIDALSHPQSAVRAAAARVVFVAGMTGAATQLAAALDAENFADAAFEQSRALAHLAGPEHDTRIIDAWKRTRAARIPIALASARGPAALALMPQIRDQMGGDTLSRYVRASMHGDDAAFAGHALTAVKAGDAPMFTAVLLASRAADVRIPESVLVTAMRDGTVPAVQTEAISHFLDGWPGTGLPAMSADLRAAILALVSAHPGTDARSIFERELAARAVGRPPTSDEAWMRVLTERAPGLGIYLARPSTGTLLTPDEIAALVRTYGLPPNFTTARPGGVRIAKEPAGAALRAATGYPDGFMETILAETGCDVSRVRAKGPGGGLAEVTLRARGAPSNVSLVKTDVPGQCEEAVRLLLMTYAAEPDRIFTEGQRELVMIPFLPDYVACQESAPIEPTPLPTLASGGTVQPPKKIKDVKPRFPMSAQADRVSGIVIVDTTLSRKGCVRRAAVVRGVDPRLDWAAMLAVLEWRFTPVALNGAPVEVMMTVTVNFTLN